MSDHQEINRRGVFTKAIETVSAVPLIVLAADNFNHQSSYQNMEFSDAKLYTSPLTAADKLNKFFDSLRAVSNAAGNLYDEYKSEYYKSRLVPYTYTDGKGRVKMGLRTEYYWDEPSGAPDHSYISSFQDSTANLSSRYQNLTGRTHIDIERLKDISIRTLNGDKRSEQILTAFVYGGEIALLLGYEELMAMTTKDYNETVREEVDESMSENQHTRRSIFKVAAALAGGVAAGAISNSIANRLSRGKEILEAEIDEADTLRATPQSQAIREYMGRTPEEIRNLLLDGSANSRAAISNRNISEHNVRNGFINLENAIQSSLENLQGIIQDNAERDKLAYVCRCAIATDKLNAANSADETLAHTSHLLESLGVGAAVAVVIGAGEVINRKFS